MSAPDVMTMSQSYQYGTPQSYTQQYLQKLNFGANGYPTGNHLQGETLSPQEDLSQVPPIAPHVNVSMSNLPLDQTQHQTLDSIAKHEPTSSATGPNFKVVIKKFYDNEEEEIDEHFTKALSEPKPRVREMRSFPASFYQQQPTSPQRASSGFGSISGSPCNPYPTFPTYGAPSAFPGHHAATSPLATTNNGDQSLWTSPYAAAYAQQFQQNHAAYAGTTAQTNTHLYNTPLHTLSASTGAGTYPQSSIFQTSQAPSTPGLLGGGGHQDQLTSNQPPFTTGYSHVLPIYH